MGPLNTAFAVANNGPASTSQQMQHQPQPIMKRPTMNHSPMSHGPTQQGGNFPSVHPPPQHQWGNAATSFTLNGPQVAQPQGNSIGAPPVSYPMAHHVPLQFR